MRPEGELSRCDGRETFEKGGVVSTVPAQRRARRAVLFGGAVASAVAVGFGVGVAQAADQRLDLADDALENAAALLQASQGPGEPARAQKRFEQAVARAIAKIEGARAQIVKAQEASDSA
jgi:hypothetical protein